jgi:F-type H+-transporting ATPase subunit b
MEIFPNWTFVPVVLLLLIFIFIANRLFFRPLSRVLEERHQRIEGAMAEAEQIKATSQKLVSDFDLKMREARRESDQQMAQITVEAQQERNRIISAKKSEVEKMLSEAKQELRQRTEEVRAKLHSFKDEFARMIASRILKRPVGGKQQPGKSV